MGARERDFEIIFRKDGGLPAEVTVIVTLFNYVHLVEETLHSVLCQSLPVLDLVIVEDHSTDASLAVADAWLKRHGQRFNRVKLIHHKRNFGLGVARNTAFRQTETPFVFVLDADNVLLERALEKLAAGLKNAVGAAAAFSYLEHFGSPNQVKIGGLSPWAPRLFLDGNKIDAMALLRKTAWEKVGGYAEDMPGNGWEDYELWIKMAEAGEWVVRVPEILCRYRIHDYSMLATETHKHVDQLTKYMKKKHKRFFSK